MVIRGDRLDKPTYRIIQTILEGNTAVCYKCWHEIFECHCVQKTISLLGVTDALAYQEPQLLKALNHPHLTEIWEAQWDPDFGDKAVTFTMPYYEGGSLHSVLMTERRFSLGEAITLACHVLDALHFLHVERKIVHRDIKPGNIFLSDGATAAYLGDLGCAAPIDEVGATFSGGTPLYRAPEAKSGRYTPQSDLYSLGLVLLEMVGGRFRYEDISQDDVQRRLNENSRTLASRHLRPPVHVPDALARIINKLLEPNPESRPRSALDVQRDLQNVVHANWRRASLDEPWTWVGEVPPARPNQLPRDVEVEAKQISRGADAGRIKLSARWRHRDAYQWRRLASLDKRVDPDDQTAWRSYFRSVSTALFQAAARR
ncbi:serine/threonine protein kinase [Micromonospora sp. C97]|uniref:serine/threonine-protein kinase n=1 Tax=Micromonospora sp. C97 TaxID=2824883 RepID=UPI001B360EB7|nr:serine/threonine protein kinase [Micromonospora sp. C97]